MKVYIACNLDGTNRAMVAAKNLKEAAKLFGTSERDLRNYGWRYASEAESLIALTDIGTVYYKALSWPSEWSTRPHSHREYLKSKEKQP